MSFDIENLISNNIHTNWKPILLEIGKPYFSRINALLNEEEEKFKDVFQLHTEITSANSTIFLSEDEKDTLYTIIYTLKNIY